MLLNVKFNNCSKYENSYRDRAIPLGITYLLIHLIVFYDENCKIMNKLFWLHAYMYRLIALIKSLQSQKCFSCTMVNAIICVGIASNDNYDILRKFKALKADVVINCKYQH